MHTVKKKIILAEGEKIFSAALAVYELLHWVLQLASRCSKARDTANYSFNTDFYPKLGQLEAISGTRSTLALCVTSMHDHAFLFSVLCMGTIFVNGRAREPC